MARNRAKIGVICGAEKADWMFSGPDCLYLGLSKRLLASISRGSVTSTDVPQRPELELVQHTLIDVKVCVMMLTHDTEHVLTV